MREDIVKEFAARAILQHNANVALALNDLVQVHNVRVPQGAEHLDLPLDLAELGRVLVRDAVALDQLDRCLLAPGAVNAELDLAKLTLTQGLQQQVIAKVHLRPPRVRRKVRQRGRRGYRRRCPRHVHLLVRHAADRRRGERHGYQG